MIAIGVDVTLVTGTVRHYVMGRSFQFDGFGDLQILDDYGNIIATRRRTTFDEVEVIYGPDPDA